METLRLNTNYDLEYYKRKCDEYMTKAIEVLEENNELLSQIIILLDENKDLLLIINQLEREKEEHRTYTVKLQISK